MLPCDMLWEWLGQQLKDAATDSNLYAFWIRANTIESSSWKEFVGNHAFK